jgi:DnaK suppressor protein
LSELDEVEAQELRADLEALRDELRVFLDHSAEGSRPVHLDAPIGRISRMDALQQQSMAKASRQAAEQRLERVEAALHRIATDEYGHCLRCEEPVGFKRLKAQPEAVLCIACQSQRETGA